MRGMLYRAFMAARFDRATFRDVRANQEAILNALGIVILTGMAMSIGMSSALVGSSEDGIDTSMVVNRLYNVWFAVVTFMLGWLIWAGMAYVVGRVFQRDQATFREILRVLGVCFGPGLLLVFMAVTPSSGVVFNAVSVWMLVAGIVALQEIRQSDWIGAIVDGSLGWVVGIQLLPGIVFIVFAGVPSGGGGG